MKTRLYMETTQVPAERTAGEIIAKLVETGARNIMQDYEGREIAGVTFTLLVRDQILAYKLPVQIDPVFKILQARRKSDPRSHAERDRIAAKRIAWRQVLRWVEAQLAMIQLEMVAADEVFLPYMRAHNGQTMYEVFVEHGQKCLPAPEET